MTTARKIADAIDEFFMNSVTMEAVYGIELPYFEEDSKDAIPGDPTECIGARQMRRVFPRSEGTVFRSSVAYVHTGQRDALGRRILYHYRMSAPTIRIIDKLDNGGDVPKEGVFKLLAPTKTQTLVYRREASKKRKKTPPRSKRTVRSKEPRALIRGTAAYLLAHSLNDSGGE